MQISVKSNVDEVRRKLTKLERKQLPFAAMMALNETAFELSRKVLPKQADRKFDGGATAFTKRGFKYRKANKTDLQAAIYIDAKQAEYLKYQIDGGIRTPKKKVILTPGYNAKVNKYGNITQSNRKKYLSGSSKYITTDRGVYEAKGRGKSRQLKKVINFVRFAKYRPKFMYYKIAEGFISNRTRGFVPRMDKHLRRAIANAK